MVKLCFKIYHIIFYHNYNTILYKILSVKIKLMLKYINYKFIYVFSQ